MTITASLPFLFDALYLQKSACILGRAVTGPILCCTTWKRPTVRCFCSTKQASRRKRNESTKIVQPLRNCGTIKMALHTRTPTPSNGNWNGQLIYSYTNVFTLFEWCNSFGILKWCGAQTKMNVPSRAHLTDVIICRLSREASAIKKTVLEEAPAVSVPFDLYMSSGAKDIFQLLRTFVKGKWDSSHFILRSYACVEQTVSP